MPMPRSFVSWLLVLMGGSRSRKPILANCLTLAQTPGGNAANRICVRAAVSTERLWLTSQGAVRYALKMPL
jgi:hypothetical protein